MRLVAISQFMVKIHSGESRCQKATELRSRRLRPKGIAACTSVPRSPEDYFFFFPFFLLLLLLLLLFWLFISSIIYALAAAPRHLRTTRGAYVKFAYVRSFVSL